jgi:L,D-peptidoglycan transpeptidase YkuD (ErfK/YbiS/YcfS/YnhG family)
VLGLAVAAALLAPTAACPPGPDVRVPPTTTQLITVVVPTTTSTRAALRLWRRPDGCWRPVAEAWPARVGRSGISANRREGDGTTPAGVFAIGRTMYGLAPNPGVRYRYRRLVCGDWWDGDLRSPTYNRFRHVRCGTRPPFTGEALWTYTTAYRHFAEIRFNADPPVPGRGSAIFLHADTGRATAGCVSLPLARLVTTLRWLDPAAAPRIAITAAGR